MTARHAAPILAIVAMLAFFGSATAQDSVSVSVQLDRSTISLNEQAVLQVTISGGNQNLPGPDMPNLPQFEVYSQGRSSNISIINGQVSASMTYLFLLVPQQAGTFPINNISVVQDNHRYVGNEVTLTVLNKGQSGTNKLEDKATSSDGQSRDYFLEAVVDDKSPYVNEQVTLTLKFFTAVQYYGSPELIEPATTGFWMEVLGNGTPYYQRINGRNYKVIERQYALFPTQSGPLTIGRASINATMAVKQRRSRDPFDMFSDFFPQGQDVTIRSEPLKIDVKPLPAEGKPTDFTGTIGSFQISATANKTEVEVNQPVTVTIRISGVGNVKSVAEPFIPDLQDFRAYNASSNENISRVDNKLGGAKIFEQIFIPKRPGTLQIPALSFNFFNPAKGKYETVTTKPIDVTVNKPEGYTGPVDVPYAPGDVRIGSQSQDIRFIKRGPDDLRPTGQVLLTRPIYLVVNALPILAFIGLVVMRKRRESLAMNVGYARSRAASRAARKRLAQAKALATVKQSEAFHAEVSRAVTQYIADKVNISPHGLTTDGIVAVLQSRNAEPDLIDQIVHLLQQADFARFAPGTVTQAGIDDALAKAESIMVRMEGVRFA